MIAVDLSKQQALDADPKAIQQINFASNLDREGNTWFCFILEEAKKTVFEFSQGTVSFANANMMKMFNFYLYKMTQYNSLHVKL